MARVTQAQRIEQDNELQALEFFERALQGLPDPRRPQGVRYPLRTVIVTALMAMVCGCDDAEAMEAWGEAYQEWLVGLVDLPHGPPTQDVFLSVFGALCPQAFGSVFRAWAQLLALRLDVERKHIAVDGKTSRRSFDTTTGRTAIHTVSAWLTQAGLVLGQHKTADKSNEIVAIPELLRTLDLRNATVTIDAMGCQTDIASAIVEGGGQYLLAVKTNQPTLHQELERTFVEAQDPRVRSREEIARPTVEVFDEVDKGHGRLERRTVKITKDLEWLSSRERWRGLSALVEVSRERTVLATQKTSVQTAYYIASDATLTAHRAGTTIRRHWSIECELHWVLDMAFREDEARHRARNTAQNLTTLRHFALNIVKQDKTRKLGVANSRKRAGWDRSYLLQLLTQTDS